VYCACRSEIGHVLRKQGKFSEAAAIYRETICSFRKYGQLAAVAHELECFAFLAKEQNQNERTARLFGSAEALREYHNSVMTPMERREYDHAVSDLRARMEETKLASAWAEGRMMNMAQAIQYALNESPY
jgi:hypothetical protein